MQRWFGESFSKLLLNRAFMVVSALCFVFYTLFSLYGCATIRVDVGPAKLLFDDSKIAVYFDIVGK